MIQGIKDKELKIQPTIRKRIGKALGDYSMINDGDKIMVGLSGGKDSLMLLTALALFRKRSPRHFDLAACTVDISGGHLDTKPLTNFCHSLEVDHFITLYPISEIIKNRDEKSPCSFCANLRRGIISSVAQDKGYNVLALGHNLDDVAETVLMNLFQTGRFKCFQPRFWQSRTNVWVIRPLIYVGEEELRSEAVRLNLPVVQEVCPFSLDTQRSRTRSLIGELEKEAPWIKVNILHALSSIRSSDIWQKEKEED